MSPEMPVARLCALPEPRLRAQAEVLNALRSETPPLLVQGDSTAENACCGDWVGFYRGPIAVPAPPPARAHTSN